MKIAALEKKQQTVFDPMVSGAGTPWEDRGTRGPVGAFFKTCFESMFSPGKLMLSIRRPETTTDSRIFLIIISVLWGLSALIHMGITLWRASQMPNVIDVDPIVCTVYCLLVVVLFGGGGYVLYSTYVKIYGRLIAQEKGAPLMTEVLLYNVNVYALGPSLLAIIPFAGPPIAVIWILCNLVVAGNVRLKLKFSAAFIDALLSFLAILGIMGGIFLLGWVFLQHIAFYYAVTTKIPTKLPHR
jgi:hypothetical protein